MVDLLYQALPTLYMDTSKGDLKGDDRKKKKARDPETRNVHAVNSKGSHLGVSSFDGRSRRQLLIGVFSGQSGIKHRRRRQR
jgi:hypothetical protein